MYRVSGNRRDRPQTPGFRFDAVGGPTLGADALAVGIAAVSDTSWFVVRKEPKGHGTKRWIEGARLGPGVKTLLVDDVVTTGRIAPQGLGHRPRRPVLTSSQQ